MKPTKKCWLLPSVNISLYFHVEFLPCLKQSELLDSTLSLIKSKLTIQRDTPSMNSVRFEYKNKLLQNHFQGILTANLYIFWGEKIEKKIFSRDPSGNYDYLIWICFSPDKIPSLPQVHSRRTFHIYYFRWILPIFPAFLIVIMFSPYNTRVSTLALWSLP